jgi:hypothetical protein
MHLWGYYPNRWPRRYWFLALFFLAAITTHSIYRASGETVVATSPEPPSTEEVAVPEPSPAAVSVAQLSLNALRARQSRTLAQAVARYSLRAGRPPPPNYDQWFQYAQQNECLIDDYEQIQRDFEPFYQLAMDDPAYFQRMIDRGRKQVPIILAADNSILIRFVQMLRESMGLKVKQQEAIGLTTVSIQNGKTLMPSYRGTVFSNIELPSTLRRVLIFKGV